MSSKGKAKAANKRNARKRALRQMKNSDAIYDSMKAAKRNYGRGMAKGYPANAKDRKGFEE